MNRLREPVIAADAKGHGTYAKAPRVALLMLSRLLNFALALQKEDMNNSPLKFWKAFPSLAVGVVFGMFFMLSLRVFYYDIMNLQPEMYPGIAFLFSPILLIAILCLALPSELLLRLLYAPTSHFNAGVIGLLYPSVLSFWAFPLHWWIVFGFNPIVLRIIFSLTHSWCGTARTMPPHSF